MLQKHRYFFANIPNNIFNDGGKLFFASWNSFSVVIATCAHFSNRFSNFWFANFKSLISHSNFRFASFIVSLTGGRSFSATSCCLINSIISSIFTANTIFFLNQCISDSFLILFSTEYELKRKKRSNLINRRQ